MTDQRILWIERVQYPGTPQDIKRFMATASSRFRFNSFLSSSPSEEFIPSEYDSTSIPEFKTDLSILNHEIRGELTAKLREKYCVEHDVVWDLSHLESSAQDLTLVLTEIPYLLRPNASLYHREAMRTSLKSLASFLTPKAKFPLVIYTAAPSSVISDEEIMKAYSFGVVRKKLYTSQRSSEEGIELHTTRDSEKEWKKISAYLDEIQSRRQRGISITSRHVNKKDEGQRSQPLRELKVYLDLLFSALRTRDDLH